MRFIIPPPSRTVSSVRTINTQHPSLSRKDTILITIASSYTFLAIGIGANGVSQVHYIQIDMNHTTGVGLFEASIRTVS